MKITNKMTRVLLLTVAAISSLSSLAVAKETPANPDYLPLNVPHFSMPSSEELSLSGPYLDRDPLFFKHAEEDLGYRNKETIIRSNQIRGKALVNQLIKREEAYDRNGNTDRFVTTAPATQCSLAGALSFAMNPLFRMGWTHECRVTHGVILSKDPVDSIMSNNNGLTSDSRIQVKVFRPLDFIGNPRVLPTIILLPPTGGETPFDAMTAEDLAWHGYQVVVIDEWDKGVGYELDITKYDSMSLRTLWAVYRSVQFVKSQAAMDHLPVGPMGIMGTSVGAIGASVAYGAIKDFQAAFLIVAGGNMPQIIGRSQQPGLASLRAAREIIYDPKNPLYNATDLPANKRDTRLQLDGQTDKTDSFTINANRTEYSYDRYVNILKQVITIDPLDFANCEKGAEKAENLYMFRGTSDITVPTKNQDQLFAAWSQSLVSPDRKCNNVENLKYVVHRDVDQDHVPTIMSAERKDIGRYVEWFNDHMPLK